MSESSNQAKEEKKALKEQKKLDKQIEKEQKKQQKEMKKAKRCKKASTVCLIILVAFLAIAVALNVSAMQNQNEQQNAAQNQNEQQAKEARDFSEQYLDMAFDETLFYDPFNSRYWMVTDYCLEEGDGCKLFVYETKVNIQGEDVDVVCKTSYTPSTGYEMKQVNFSFNGETIDSWWFKNTFDRMLIGEEYDEYFEDAHGSGFESIEALESEE